MMEGQGVTNYTAGKPAYGFSTATTEFDDALIARGIVTFEQAMIAKGASPSEARRLAELNEGKDNCLQSGLSGNFDNDGSTIQHLGDGHDELSEASSQDDDDEQFLTRYRQSRIDDMKKGRKQEYGDVIPISRPDWNREVNEASRNGLWVVVNLTRSSSSLSISHDEVCDKIEEISQELAEKFVDIKFVSIPCTSAIENWPPENLPSLFCYRYGKMQHQLIGVDSFGGAGVNSGRLEWRLAVLQILETELGEDPRPEKVNNIKSDRVGSQFGGAMSSLATRRSHDNDDDYDGVD